MEDWSPDIERLQALDDQAWLLVEQHYCGRLLAYALRRTGDLQASEDVLQESLLGAVRGISGFDSSYSFEQYLFGICRNRTVDHLRRRRAQTVQVGEDEEGLPGMEVLAQDIETPSGIVRGRELSSQAVALLGQILRDWVEETWEQGEFVRMGVVEALLSGGWRNRDTWSHFGLADETAVAGIKFRALKRLRQIAALRGSGSDLMSSLSLAAEDEDHLLDLDVRSVWRSERVSCPARHWIARLLQESLEEGPALFVNFHLEEMACEWCQANRDDLAEADRRAELDPMIERVQESTLRYLRSRAGR